MKGKNSHSKTLVNKQRRRLVQGVGVAAAATVVGPAISKTINDASGSGDITGKLVSKLGDPVKSVILRNNTPNAITVNHFHNGSVVFDGEFVDCNGLCDNSSVTLSSGEEKIFQFDKRELFNSQSRSESWVNLQSNVKRMSEGTRVVDISGDVKNGVVTLHDQSVSMFS